MNIRQKESVIKTQLFNSLFIEAKNEVPSPHHKVMIIMHGLGDRKESFVDIASEINVTGLAYLLIDAPRPYPIGHSWYEIPPGNPQIGIHESSEMILKLIDELISAGYRHSDIFLCGFSQGGCMAIQTLLKLQTPLAGVVALSPRIYEEYLPITVSSEATKTPLFIAHGEFDGVIPFKQTMNGAQKLADLGYEVQFNSYDMDHEIDVIEIRDVREWLNEYL